jgi:hypothetical protein
MLKFYPNQWPQYQPYPDQIERWATPVIKLGLVFQTLSNDQVGNVAMMLHQTLELDLELGHS